MKNLSNKKPISDILFNTFIILILSVYALCMIFLLVWGFTTSLKSSVEFSLINNVVGFPTTEWSAEELKFGNYDLAFDMFKIEAKSSYYVGQTLVNHYTTSGIWKMFFNTLVYMVIGITLPTLVCYTVAFLTSKYKFKLSGFVYGFAVFMLAVPTVGTQPAVITMLRSLGIYDTYFCHVFQKFNFGGMYYFVFYAFFEGLPDAYTEAAEIDGASQLRVYLNIIIPLGLKFISSVALLNAVTFWNDYQAPLIYTPTLPTLAYGVYGLVNLGGNAELKTVPGQITCCMLLALPLLVLFISLKDKLMGNMSMGGLKG